MPKLFFYISAPLKDGRRVLTQAESDGTLVIFRLETYPQASRVKGGNVFHLSTLLSFVRGNQQTKQNKTKKNLNCAAWRQQNLENRHSESLFSEDLLTHVEQRNDHKQYIKTNNRLSG